jgi:FkbM family methyltransferase
MKRYFIEFLRKQLRMAGVEAMRHDTFENLVLEVKKGHDMELIQSVPERHILEIVQNLSKSKSQLRQDLFVLSELDFIKEGFFVEFGATNGLDLSNTFLLEKGFGWKGILSEPARCWQHDLAANRTCYIENKCVWKDSGSVLTFNEVDDAELSTIRDYSKRDIHRTSRKSGHMYEVETISLVDMLKKYNAPHTIDYLSIDTEGSEFEILRAFDFDAYKFRVITCEHNFTDARDKILDLLIEKGYRRKFESLSKFDDWYVLS